MILKRDDNPKLGLNEYSCTKVIPEGWEEIELDLRKAKNRQALNSPKTNFIKILKGWKGSKKWSKPIIKYATNTKKIAEIIMKHGDISNAEKFIFSI